MSRSPLSANWSPCAGILDYHEFIVGSSSLTGAIIRVKKFLISPVIDESHACFFRSNANDTQIACSAKLGSHSIMLINITSLDRTDQITCSNYAQPASAIWNSYNDGTRLPTSLQQRARRIGADKRNSIDNLIGGSN